MKEVKICFVLRNLTEAHHNEGNFLVAQKDLIGASGGIYNQSFCHLQDRTSQFFLTFSI